MGVGEAAESVRGAVERAVRRRMVADVPVCTYLSGGIDSTIVASEMVRAGGAPDQGLLGRVQRERLRRVERSRRDRPCPRSHVREGAVHGRRPRREPRLHGAHRGDVPRQSERRGEIPALPARPRRRLQGGAHRGRGRRDLRGLRLLQARANLAAPLVGARGRPTSWRGAPPTLPAARGEVRRAFSGTGAITFARSRRGTARIPSFSRSGRASSDASGPASSTRAGSGSGRATRRARPCGGSSGPTGSRRSTRSSRACISPRRSSRRSFCPRSVTASRWPTGSRLASRSWIATLVDVVSEIPAEHHIELDDLREKAVLRRAFEDRVPARLRTGRKHPFFSPGWRAVHATRRGARALRRLRLALDPRAYRDLLSVVREHRNPGLTDPPAEHGSRATPRRHGRGRPHDADPPRRARRTKATAPSGSSTSW
jgi:hypothetical protein